MLNTLRKKAQSPFIQVLVLVIAIVFVFWGVGSDWSGQRAAVATVNTAEISLDDYARAYNRELDLLRQQLGGQLPPGFIEQFGIKDQVVFRLIQAELLRQGGEAMGLRISGLPVQKSIEEMEIFHEGGHFSLQRYKDILSQNRMTPVSFEEDLRADLYLTRVRDQVQNFALVSEHAVDRWIRYTEEAMQLAYVEFKPADFTAEVLVEEQDLAAWFEEQQEQYRTEPKVQVQYLFVDQQKIEQELQPSAEDLQARYAKDLEYYHLPEQRQARHILIQVEAHASAEERAARRQRAEEILHIVQQPGSNFALLADHYSEDPNKGQGGDLGFFQAGRMEPAVDRVVFSLQPGEISEVIETASGYQIFKLEEILPASYRSFEEVQESLAQRLKREQAQTLSAQQAFEAYEGIMLAGSLENYSQKTEQELVLTEYFSRSVPGEGITARKAFVDTAFRLKPGELSSIVDLGTGHAILYLKDRQEPEIPALSTVRDQVQADYIQAKSKERAAKAAEDLLARTREKGSLELALARNTAEAPEQSQQENLEELGEEIGEEHALRIQTTDFFTRYPEPGVNVPNNRLIQESFQLPWKEKLAKQPLEVEASWFVYEVLDRRSKAQEAMESSEREMMQDLLFSSAQNDVLNAWMHSVQAQARIRIYQERL
jgi:peptidyl-prolyl cis-trans isomerase D